MIPCPKYPIFTYGVLKTPQKILVLVGKIEGSMQGILKGYKLKEHDKLIKTGKISDEVNGEILWINLEQYEELVQALDSYGKASHKTQDSYKRVACEVTTNEPIYRGIPPTSIKCWTYKCK